MNEPLSLSGDVLIITRRDAHLLSRAILSAADLAHRHGANLNPKVLHLAARIHSVTGHSEPARTSFEDNVEYEQITTTQAAEILGCSDRNVRSLAQRDRLPGVKKGKPWFFNRDDVEVYRDNK